MLLIHFRDIMVLNFQQWTISTIEPQNVAPVLGHMEAVGGFIGTYETSDWLTLRNSQSKGSKFRKTFYKKAKIWFHEFFFRTPKMTFFSLQLFRIQSQWWISRKPFGQWLLSWHYLGIMARRLFPEVIKNDDTVKSFSKHMKK